MKKQSQTCKLRKNLNLLVLTVMSILFIAYKRFKQQKLTVL